MNTFISLAFPIGTAVSGILLYELGYYGVFLIALSFYVFALIYASLTIKDKPAAIRQDTETGCKAWGSVLSYHHVLQTFNVATKNRVLKKRLRILLLILCYFTVAGPVHGNFQININWKLLIMCYFKS